MEGKEYVVKDGDVLLFKFNVSVQGIFNSFAKPGWDARLFVSFLLRELPLSIGKKSIQIADEY
jgi:hypothetical protein